MKKLLTLFISFTALHAGAQIDSCNVFLQGNYVEVGISPYGSYGSSVGAPSGYHGNVGSGSYYYSSCGAFTTGSPHLGFVADPAMDGWTVGSPAYMGDYFLPGSPFEGWELQIGGGNVQAFNGDSSFTGSLASVSSGSNISYSDVGGVVSSTWQGIVDSVQVTQVTSLDTGGLFFTMQVTLTNLSSSPIDNIYYLRSLDPDNLEVEGYGFSTSNLIVSQGPDSATLITASAYDSTGAIVPLSQLALGSTDTNSRCLVYGSWPLSTSADLSTLYNNSFGSGYWATGIPVVGDDAIGLVYNIPHLASVDSAADSVGRAAAGSHPANKAILEFFYAFSQAGRDSAVSAAQKATASGSLSVKNVNAQATINVYPNPSTNMINVTGLNTGDNLELVDMMGRSATLNGSSTNQFSVNGFAPGNYILVVKDADGNVRWRVEVRKQ